MNLTSLIAALIRQLQSDQQQIEDDAMLRDIVREQRRPSSDALPRASTVKVVGAAPGGFYEPKPLSDWRPPDERVFNQLMGQQDKLDRAARKKELGE